jgi:outer membrane immunogenic protein
MKVVRILAAALAVASPLSMAAAADIPVEGAIYEPRPVALIFRWTGVYIGLHAGGGWGFIQENSVPFPVPPQALGPAAGPGPGTLAPLPARVDMNGGITGGQIGLNYQTNWLVIGFEGQASWANLNGSTACIVTAASPVTVTGANCTDKIDALGTAAVRLGVAFDHLLIFDHLLVYGKGGAAWANNGYQIKINLAPGTLVFSTNELKWGWMLGIGAEYAFTNNWSAKIEYNYMDMGSHAQRFTDSIGGNLLIDTDIRERLNVVKVGVNYRFGVNPILIK